MMKHFPDVIALAHRKSGRKYGKAYALKHIPTGLYFHKSVQKHWNPEDNYYVAPYPMYRRTKGAFAYFLAEFLNPEEWAVEVLEFEVKNGL